jgi:uncharacterized protein
VSFPELPQLPAKRRLFWTLHLIIIASYLLALGALGFFGKDPEAAPALRSGDNFSLMVNMAINLGLFAVFLGVALAFSRARPWQLMLQWNGGIKPLLYGFAYSLALRLLLAILLMAFLLVMAGVTRSNPEQLANAVKPDIKTMVDPSELANDPVFLAINVTFVSFIVAGLREELWRAATLAGMAALFPVLFRKWWGKTLAVFIVAIIFGLGHLPQGPGGVVLTGVLGFGLGMIMVWHRSIWEAVIAHGFFDAASFVALFVIAKYFPQFLDRF